MADRETGSASSSPARAAGGCFFQLLFAWLAMAVCIGVTGTIVDALSPTLAMRGYNMKTGAGVFIALGLGLVVSVYPILWTYRAGRALRRRLRLRR